MPPPPPFVDIHCHLLPEMDDGAGSWDETLAMARLAVDDGIATVVATPHQLGRHAHNSGKAILARTAQTQRFLHEQNVPLQVLPGADVRIEPDMIRKLQHGEVLTLADKRRHVLLELPHDVYLPLEGLLSKLRAVGIAGILSHPERNLGILGQPQVLAPLVRAGCLMQVTASALIGAFGPQVEKFARGLLKQGLVHFVSTDAHGAKSRRPLIGRAFDCIARLVGEETAVDLCCRNPARVAAGESVQPLRRPPRTMRLGGWFRWNKAG